MSLTHRHTSRMFEYPLRDVTAPKIRKKLISVSNKCQCSTFAVSGEKMKLCVFVGVQTLAEIRVNRTCAPKPSNALLL